jgi:hypothetical protein
MSVAIRLSVDLVDAEIQLDNVASKLGFFDVLAIGNLSLYVPSGKGASLVAAFRTALKKEPK